MWLCYRRTEDRLYYQMPTFKLFKDGAQVKEVVGANPAALTV
jgi:hypothetical protein